MSPREFDGWVAREVHEHFDAEGNLTGTTVVTRETPWDDESRGRALKLAEYERSLCSCCGLPRAVAHSEQSAFYVGTYTCYAGRAVERVQRDARKKAENEKRPDGWDDGQHYYVREHDID